MQIFSSAFIQLPDSLKVETIPMSVAVLAFGIWVLKVHLTIPLALVLHCCVRHSFGMRLLGC